MSSSAENGGIPLEKSTSPARVPLTMPRDKSFVGVDKPGKKEARFTKYTKDLNYLTIAKYLFFLLALVGVIVLAIQVSKDQDAIQKLNNELTHAPHVRDAALEDRIGDRMSYLEGFNGMVDDDDTISLVARAVMATVDPSTVTAIVHSTVIPIVASSVDEPSTSTTCTDTTEVSTSTATFIPVGNSTTATDSSSDSTVHIMATTTVFNNITGTSVLSAETSTSSAGSSISSVDAISALSVMESSIMSEASTATFTVVPVVSTTTAPETTPIMTLVTLSTTLSTTSHTCLEWGDMSGPCNRPYGAPNAPPSSVTLSIPDAPTVISSTLSFVTVASVSSATTPSSTVSLMTVASASSTTITSSTVSLTTVTSVPSSPSGSTTLDTGAVSGTEIITTSTSSSALDTAACAPPTTIYVTVSTATPSVEGGISVESIAVGPTVESVGTASPSTVTSTSTSLVTTITSTLPSATETVVSSNNATILTLTGSTTSRVFTATGFTLTMTAHNGTYTPTTGPAPVATLPASSGGDRAAGGKPMGASGNGGTGNGMYCVVMLVTLLALLM
ncbi:hypothetical protein diail_1231 [Diaporthe ilicicola]|nr:hypothetical protein diail_1231 [Diaporthe ilicicola]